MINRIFFIAFFITTGIFGAYSQVDENSELFRSLKQQDSIFFERSFNQCDLEYLEENITADLEFYHDKGGYQDRATFLKNTKENICAGTGAKPVRKVDENSLEVFPMYKNGKLYAAIQKGVHHFYLREKGKAEVQTGTAKFTHVWRLENRSWKLAEVLSYDHGEPAMSKTIVNIEQLLKENAVPALGLGIIEKGKLTKVEVYGTLDKTTPAPYNTIFKVASLTKPVVAVTALKLIDKGMMNLDEPLHQYWTDPDLRSDERHKLLTPRLVLTHQTGFPNWRYLNETGKLAFEFDPGSKYQYSGEGFEYLRKAMESKFGASIEQLAEEHVFSPAGMTDTRFWWDEEMDESRYAQNFDKEGKKIETTKYYEANAAANLLTTVEDYGRFLSYVINGAELSSDLFQEMQSRQVKLKENDYFGLGWEILTNFTGGEYALLHTGGDPGVRTLAVIFPKSKNGYLIFLNAENVDAILETILNDWLYLGKELWGRR
ncbi:serine hydrolase [Salinimicrobium oceani]|uniref:Serine hydrolase n=1 Tax=Salinimicrobium oceani TaxID=2722702 RepID=A0ABX1D4X7_9FLAO|nr:serine hydrolase [Salinimicrobium oceani]NJW54061.1 serine hydrolase [Salinimicrobium oceani]